MAQENSIIQNFDKLDNTLRSKLLSFLNSGGGGGGSITGFATEITLASIALLLTDKTQFTKLTDGINNLVINADGSLNFKETAQLTEGSVNNVRLNNVVASQLDSGGNICKEVYITADINNTGYTKIGFSTLNANNGIVLYPNETITLKVSNTNKIYALAEVLGDKVSLLWVL